MGTHSALLKGSHTRAHTAKHGPSLPRPQHGLVLPAKSPPKEQPEEADARPTACVRFLRRRGPAGLRNLLSGLPMFAFLTPCAQGFLRAQCEMRYHDPQYVPHIAEIPGGRLTKQLICRFQRPGKHRSLRGAYFLTKMQIFPLGNSVANTFAV